MVWSRVGKRHDSAAMTATRPQLPWHATLAAAVHRDSCPQLVSVTQKLHRRERARLTKSFRSSSSGSGRMRFARATAVHRGAKFVRSDQVRAQGKHRV